MKYQLKINTKEFTVEVGDITTGRVPVVVNGRVYDVLIEDSAVLPRPSLSAGGGQTPSPIEVEAAEPSVMRPPSSSSTVPGAVIAPIPGLILEIKVRVGESVRAGQVVAVMEAMKMENNLTAPVSGTIKEIRMQKGSEVSTGDVVILIVSST
jgi:biotin carboxyl carrier protein